MAIKSGKRESVRMKERERREKKKKKTFSRTEVIFQGLNAPSNVETLTFVLQLG